MRKLDNKKFGVDSNSSIEEENNKIKRVRLFKELQKLKLSISDIVILLSSRMDVTRVLYYNEIYKQILKKPGVIMEFGCRYGASLSILQKLRSIYEPYNYVRKIIGFDTFQGFTNDFTSDERKKWKKGDYGVTPKYEKVLDKILSLEEENAPIKHLKKFEMVKIIKGDASTTVKNYLEKNKETVIGLAIFDMDMYKPTKKVLKEIKKRLFKGSILVFDELSHSSFPGETQAVIKEIGLNNLKLNSFHGQNGGCWVEII